MYFIFLFRAKFVKKIYRNRRCSFSRAFYLANVGRRGRWKEFYLYIPQYSLTLAGAQMQVSARNHGRISVRMSILSFLVLVGRTLVLSSPARLVPVGRWRQEPDRLQKRLRFEKSESEEGLGEVWGRQKKREKEKERPEITGRSWAVKIPGRIAEYGWKPPIYKCAG